MTAVTILESKQPILDVSLEYCTDFALFLDLMKTVNRITTLEFTSEGLECRAMDLTHVVLLKAWFPKQAFTTYKVPDKPYTLHLNTDVLLRRIRGLEFGMVVHYFDKVSILDASTKNMLRIKRYKTTSEMTKSTVDAKYLAKFNIDLSFFGKCANVFAEFNAGMKMAVHGGRLWISDHYPPLHHGYKFHTDFNVPLDEDLVDANALSVYSAEYLSEFLRAIPQDNYFDTIRVELGNEVPIHLVVRESTACKIEWYLAPRMESNEENEKK